MLLQNRFHDNRQTLCDPYKHVHNLFVIKHLCNIQQFDIDFRTRPICLRRKKLMIQVVRVPSALFFRSTLIGIRRLYGFDPTSLSGLLLIVLRRKDAHRRKLLESSPWYNSTTQLVCQGFSAFIQFWHVRFELVLQSSIVLRAYLPNLFAKFNTRMGLIATDIRLPKFETCNPFCKMCVCVIRALPLLWP